MNTNVILGAIVVVLLAVIGYMFLYNSNQITTTPTETSDGDMVDDTPMPVEPDGGIGDGAQPLPEMLEEKPMETIGTSSDGNEIIAYHFGSGEKELLFVGGTHAGYSGNTTVVAYELIDYLEGNPDAVPDTVKVTVIPVLNPDGLEAVYGTTDRVAQANLKTDHTQTTPGRFNGNNVDLNRNFDCEWKAQGTWQDRTVSGGSEPFSEPEARAVRDYVETHDIAGAVVWYSAAGGVYSSSCNNGVSAETKTLTNLYANAAGYSAHEEFDFYEITGDMVNWLAKKGVPAISVLMTDHENPEWSKNKAGITAMLNYFAK